MKITLRDDRPCCTQVWLVPQIEVHLDGVKQKHCIEADDERGYVDVFADPLLIVGGGISFKGDEPQLLVHRLFGRVEIRGMLNLYAR